MVVFATIAKHLTVSEKLYANGGLTVQGKINDMLNLNANKSFSIDSAGADSTIYLDNNALILSGAGYPSLKIFNDSGGAPALEFWMYNKYSGGSFKIRTGFNRTESGYGAKIYSNANIYIDNGIYVKGTITANEGLNVYSAPLNANGGLRSSGYVGIYQSSPKFPLDIGTGVKGVAETYWNAAGNDGAYFHHTGSI